MIYSAEDASLLCALLEKEFEVIERNFALNVQAENRINQGATHTLDWAALGYTLHTLYVSFENYFLRISKAFENNLPQDSWHKELLLRMELEIPGVRPRLLDQDLAGKLDALRGFRHVFRVVYDSPLDPKRLMVLQETVQDIQKSFAQSHQDFLNKVADQFA